MTLRLVLVSLVAALGLTLPGGPMIESWVAATQNWMNARLADWDTRNPQEADYVIISDAYDASLASTSRPAVAESTANQSRSIGPVWSEKRSTPILSLAVASPPVTPVVRPASFARKLVSFTPISISMREMPGIMLADELNRRHDGLDPASRPVMARLKVASATAPFGAVGSTYAMMAFEPGQGSRATTPVAAVRSEPPRFTPIVVAQNFYEDIAYQLNHHSDGITVKPIVDSMKKADVAQAPAAAAVVEVASFGSMEASEDLYFDGPIEEAEPKVADQATEKPAIAITPVSTLEPGEELVIELASGLVPEADGFASVRVDRKVEASTPASTEAMGRLSDRGFEPLDVADELCVGIAYELNRRNDGLSLPAADVAQTKLATPTLPARELSRAVKLTGEAVYAWVSVLTGPAVVTVSK